MSAIPTLPIANTAALDLLSGEAPETDKLHKAAQEFEALLVGQMLKSARPDGSDGWLGSGDSGAGDSAMDMAESQFANALSTGRGIGLAAVIERAMQKGSAQNTAETPPANSDISAKMP